MIKKIALGFFAAAMVTSFFASEAQAISYPDGTLITSDKHPAVYQIENNKRRPFFNATVYNTWYADFSAVQKISVANVESIELGNPMSIKPNTKLLKFPLNPRVYAITSKETIQYIPDEATAINLYGATWATKVTELPEIYYLFYVKGSALSSVGIPGSTSFSCPPGMVPQAHPKFGFGVCHDSAGVLLETNNTIVFTAKSGGSVSAYPGKVKFVTGFATVDAYVNHLNFGIQKEPELGVNANGVSYYAVAGGSVDNSGYHVIFQDPDTKKIFDFDYNKAAEAEILFTDGMRNTFRFLK